MNVARSFIACAALAFACGKLAGFDDFHGGGGGGKGGGSGIGGAGAAGGTGGESGDGGTSVGGASGSGGGGTSTTGGGGSSGAVPQGGASGSGADMGGSAGASDGCGGEFVREDTNGTKWYELLRNGDFEAGVEHWDLISDYDAERMIVHRDVLRDLGESITPHGGYYLAWVGGTPDGESPIELGRPGRFWATQMYQTITIPANITRLVMSGYRWITSEEQQSAEERDFADCLIETLMDEGEEQLFEAAPYFNNTQEEPRWVDFGDAAWPEDIAEMAGRTVNVFIGSHNDTMGITSFFFDDISVQVTCD